MIKQLIKSLIWRQFVRNYNPEKNFTVGRALLYFKTDPFVLPWLTRNYTHTNNWEIMEMARILNRHGYVVDILDRTAPKESLNFKDEYDVFIGIGAGDSGKHFAHIAAQVPSALKIFFAAGPEPDLSNELIHKRYAYFYERHPGAEVKLRRLIEHVDVQAAMNNTDVIFCIGNSFGISTYAKYEKPIYRMYPSSAPELALRLPELVERDQRSFLYFGGNGNIVKGLDIVIEAFTGLPELTLYIGAPDGEEDFNRLYAPLLEKFKNIHMLGFVDVRGSTFDQITKKCGHIIFASCSEGTTTSVTTCMRRGLIPVVTKESGIDVGDFGYLLEDIALPAVQAKVRAIAGESRKEFTKRGLATYNNSFQYTQAAFSAAFEQALLEALAARKLA